MTRKPRQAFTLIELLVVVGIMLVLSAIIVSASIRNADRKYAQDGADRISGWLLLAKQWALRDQAPRGLRLVVDNNPVSPTAGMVLQRPPMPGDTQAMVGAQYIEQPDPWVAPGTNVTCTAGTATIFAPVPPVPPALVDVLTGGFGAASSPLLWPVQVNDVIEMGSGANMQAQILTGVGGNMLAVRGGPVTATGVSTTMPGAIMVTSSGHGLTSGVRLMIQGCTANTAANGLYQITLENADPLNQFSLNRTSGTTTAPESPPGSWSTVTSNFSGTNWRIIRQPRPRPGEAPLTLPRDVVVDLNASAAAPYTGWEPIISGTPVFIDIMFAPSGAVMGGVFNGVGTSAFSKDLKLWVRDTSVPWPICLPSPPNPPHTPSTTLVYGGEVFIVTVSLRTGLISVHPADATHNGTNYTRPYSFTQDGRASGL